MQNYPPLTAPPQIASSSLATSSLVCGICGVIFGPLTGIPAIITGHMALSRIKKSEGTLQGHGKAVAGLILGYIFTALFIVIALLASAGFAAANAAFTKARKATTLLTAVAIEQAITNYYLEYGSMPYKGTSDTTICTNVDIEILHVLLGIEKAMNYKSINFLAIKEGKENKDGIIYDKDGSSVIGLYDPWGGGYNIRLDLDSNEKINVGGEDLVNRHVAVWSDGPDRKPGTDDDVKTWK